MTFHRSITAMISLCLITIFAADAFAQFGIQKRKREQERLQRLQNTPIGLTETSGPWLIMCASFVGEEAEVQATQLVRELRNQYGLMAYTYNHHFEFTDMDGIGFDPTEGLQVTRERWVAKPLKMKALHDSSFDEIAVLVGDYPNIEDALAQEHLQGIKYLMPASLGKMEFNDDRDGLVTPEEASNQRMRTWRAVNKTVNANADKRKGPMGAAFLLPNPILPDEYFTAHQVDDFVLNLNRKRGIKHSLLDNPGHYSVRIATFRGDSTFELDQIQEDNRRFKFNLQRGQTIQESKLAIALAKAHRLTLELRKLGIAAYEFHDRHESYVCVGEFEWLKRDQNGREYQNPKIVETIEVFKGRVENFPGVQGAVRAKTLANVVRAYGIDVKRIPDLAKLGIAFDVQPIPVQVPRTQGTRTARSISGANFR
jgi:hypothetical protein